MYSAYAPVSYKFESFVHDAMLLTPVGKPKNFISNIESLFGLVAECLDHPGEFNPKGLWSLWRNWILAFSLEDIHTIEAESFHLY